MAVDALDVVREHRLLIVVAPFVEVDTHSFSVPSRAGDSAAVLHSGESIAECQFFHFFILVVRDSVPWRFSKVIRSGRVGQPLASALNGEPIQKRFDCQCAYHFLVWCFRQQPPAEQGVGGQPPGKYYLESESWGGGATTGSFFNLTPNSQNVNHQYSTSFSFSVKIPKYSLGPPPTS